MADADQPLATRPSSKLGEDVAEGRIRQVGPAHDAEERRRRGGKGEELPRLVQLGPCLDDDRAIHTGRSELRQQLVERERAPDRIDLGGHPRVRRPIRIEDVVVRVDDPGHRGTGAPAGMSPSCRSSSQSAAGIDRRIAAG